MNRKNLKLLFIVRNETRWNSYYDALVRVKHILNTKITELKLVFDEFGITFFRSAEEEFIIEYVKVMQPLAQALDILQGDINISIGFLLSTLTLLIRKMEAIKTKQGIIHCKGIV